MEWICLLPIATEPASTGNILNILFKEIFGESIILELSVPNNLHHIIQPLPFPFKRLLNLKKKNSSDAPQSFFLNWDVFQITNWS